MARPIRSIEVYLPLGIENQERGRSVLRVVARTHQRLSLPPEASVPTPPGGLQTPLQIAESGGRHAGFLRLRVGNAADELVHEAQTLRKRAAEHQAKIVNRIGYN